MSDRDIAIRIQGIGKKYKLGETFDTARNFRETLMSLPRHFSRKAGAAAKTAARKLREEASAKRNTADSHILNPRQEGNHFWAVRDIDLEIKRGEAVGIIGRNGAGKSTLLKILSRITAPTEGCAEIRGRVGALLEVGTGMHPELTGRENIYLNGAIIGMTKGEIDSKFDRIVDFAGTEAFLDTPLKRYSSGMRVRLGFSVAAHLEPEVLIVDEVLSVGDAEFRKKCLGKMDDVTQGGRTVLFVSHNMQAVRVLCNRAIILEEGRLLLDGPATKTIDAYLGHRDAAGATRGIDAFRVVPPGDFEILQYRFLNADHNPLPALQVNTHCFLEIRYRIRNRHNAFRFNAVISTNEDFLLAQVHSDDATGDLTGEPGREYTLRVGFRNPFLPGSYRLSFFVRDSHDAWAERIEAMPLNVESVGETKALQIRPGQIELAARWEGPFEQ